MNTSVGTTKQFAQGFTIVELAVVILVIGILATLVTFGYNGMQEQARDSTRISDMKTIGKALEIYKSRNGAYPPVSPSSSGWSNSHQHPTNYINGLHGNGQTIKNLPIDPENNSTYYYRYYVYNAGDNGCDSNLGRYYVLMAMRMESVASGTAHPDSPGFACASRNWQDEGAWAQGGFING